MLIDKFIDYLTLEKSYSHNTINAYYKDLKDFENFSKSKFDNINIEDSNYSIIRSWIVELVNTGVSNRTVNRKVSSLKSFFKFLIKTDSIKSIYDCVIQEAMTYKFGGGCGHDLSILRPSGDQIVGTGGNSCGPVGFMNLFSENTNTIAQHGSCLLYTSPSPRDLSTSRMPSSA